MFSRNSSDVWEHWTDLKNGFAQCNYCEKVIKKIGTSNYRRHTSKVHSNQMPNIEPSQTQIVIKDSLLKTVKKFNNLISQNLLLKFIILNYHSFTLVEEPAFQ
ncbi:5466_t:CDS:2, partial [Gigaspora rosea]